MSIIIITMSIFEHPAWWATYNTTHDLTRDVTWVATRDANSWTTFNSIDIILNEL